MPPPTTEQVLLMTLGNPLRNVSKMLMQDLFGCSGPGRRRFFDTPNKYERQMKSNQPSKTKGNRGMKKSYPDTCTVSRFRMEEYLAKPIGDPWVDYLQECYNPTTKQTVVRSVQRDYAPWFLDAVKAATA
jgi:hypothetical protein